MRSALLLSMIFVILVRCEDGHNGLMTSSDLSHAQITGNWRQMQVRHYGSNRSLLGISDYSEASCPEFMVVSLDSMKHYATSDYPSLSPGGMPHSIRRCYFSTSGHYSYTRGVGIVREKDTLRVGLSGDTLLLSRMVNTLSQGSKMELSCYLRYGGEVPSRASPCLCHDSVSSASSR
jgi:hypothetical protein